MRKYLLGFLLVFSALSCEDVVDVDLPSETPKLVIEANLKWVKGTSGNEQVIKLTRSTPYFSENPNQPAVGATVSVQNLDTNESFEFQEETSGIYKTITFVPVLNANYSLKIEYRGEVFSAQDVLRFVPDINTVTQSKDEGFDPELTEVNIFFDDSVDEENYYLTTFRYLDELPYHFALQDEYTNGNEMTMFYEYGRDNGLEVGFQAGDVVDISLASISKGYYNYLSLLLSQNDSQGPFGVTPAPLIGNCINETNTDDAPFGYFTVSETVEMSYTIQ